MTEGFQGGTPGNGHDGDRPLERLIHPGSGRRKAPATRKGRQVEPETRAEIHALLGDRPRNRDLLIEFLHLLQDRYGHLSARHLAALAEEMKIAMAEVYEVASFYAHFDIITEGETPPPALTVRVCDSLSCELAGRPGPAGGPAGAAGRGSPGAAGALHGALRACAGGRGRPSPYRRGARSRPSRKRRRRAIPMRSCPPIRISPPISPMAAIELLKACLAGPATSRRSCSRPSRIRGCAAWAAPAFPPGRKWRIVSQQPAPRLLTVNADEGEPGTFKDRVYLEQDPHRFIEGALIGAWASGCERGYVYLRDEYPAIHTLLHAELAKVSAAGLDKHCPLELRRGAGAFICGEESAMMA